MQDIVEGDKPMESTMRTFITTMLVSLCLATTAMAQEDQPAAAPETDPWEACSPLAISPEAAGMILKGYGSIFGKEAIRWKESDYRQVIELAMACNGVKFQDGTVISGEKWQISMDDAMVQVLPTASVYAEVTERSQYIFVNEIKLPECNLMVVYLRDTEQFRDNSKDIFGVPLWGMEVDDLRAVVEHTNNCMAFLPEFGEAVYGLNSADVKIALNGIMDRALEFKNYRDAWRKWDGRRETDLMVEVEGYKIPPTFAHGETANLVKRFNRSIKVNGKMATNTVYTLVSIADGILQRNMGEIDDMFANAVKDAVTGDIFERTGV